MVAFLSFFRVVIHMKLISMLVLFAAEFDFSSKVEEDRDLELLVLLSQLWRDCCQAELRLRESVDMNNAMALARGVMEDGAAKAKEGRKGRKKAAPVANLGYAAYAWRRSLPQHPLRNRRLAGEDD